MRGRAKKDASGQRAPFSAANVIAAAARGPGSGGEEDEVSDNSLLLEANDEPGWAYHSGELISLESKGMSTYLRFFVIGALHARDRHSPFFIRTVALSGVFKDQVSLFEAGVRWLTRNGVLRIVS